MNHVLKIDERAFNNGVKEVLQLKPIVRAVKSALTKNKSYKNQTETRSDVAKR